MVSVRGIEPSDGARCNQPRKGQREGKQNQGERKDHVGGSGRREPREKDSRDEDPPLLMSSTSSSFLPCTPDAGVRSLSRVHAHVISVL